MAPSTESGLPSTCSWLPVICTLLVFYGTCENDQQQQSSKSQRLPDARDLSDMCASTKQDFEKHMCDTDPLIGLYREHRFKIKSQKLIKLHKIPDMLV